HRREGLDVVLAADRSALTIAPGAPVDAVGPHVALELVHLLLVSPGVGVDAEENELLATHAIHERPLVWEHSPAGASPEAPEVEDNYLPAVVRELERLAVRVLALDVRCDV